MVLTSHLRYGAVAFFFALIFLGVGCAPVEEVVDDAFIPVSTSIDALGRAKELTEQNRAKVAYEDEQRSNEISVAFIITENASVPSGVELSDSGTIGCNDRVAYAKVSRETATGDTLYDALATLFSVRETNYHGLYNSLAGSSLAVSRVLSRDGVTTDVEIKGDIISSGACDDPRIRSQIEETIRRFRPNFRVILNGSERDWRCFGDQSGTCK